MQPYSTTLRTIYKRLFAAYGPQRWWPARSSFEVVVGAYLVQNTAWRNVERSIANIRSFANIDANTPLDVDHLRSIPSEELRALIRPSGYMIRKGAALIAFIVFLDEQYEGSLEKLAAQSTATLREQLLALPGVGPETADAILLYALGHPVMVVDEYLRRIASRHALLPEKPTYATLQQFALAAFDDDAPATLSQHFNEFHALIVEVGKNHCGPRPRCEGCPLQSLLPTA
jgi:endonuclease-3 related protein